MKKNSGLMTIAFTFFFINSTHKEIVHTPCKTEGTSRWTGEITMQEITIISVPGWTGKSERNVHASFINALPTLYRDDETTDLNFTDDKGPGSHSFHGEATLAGRTCVTDCQGSGKAELHTVVVNEGTNTYDIEVVSPECKGTTCADEGGTKEYGPESLSVIVSDHPLGANKDVLAGTKTETGELAGSMGTFTRTISWHFVRVKEDDVELIVTPEGYDKAGAKKKYDSWLPEPGRNEMIKGSVMTINLKLQGKDGKPLKVKAESFELRLSGTSTEPGITINYPVEPDPKQLPDLRFLLLPNIESVDEDQFISISSPDGITGKTYIASYDGGGWTTLTVEAILKDKRHILGKLLVSNGERDIRIPKRDPNAHIAEAWLKANGNPGEIDDKEKSDGNKNDGDGLTAYEEYRGVISEGKFKRLDPNKKEVGILATQTDFSLFNEGIGWFKNASDLNPVRFDFDKDEIGGNGRLNANKKTAHSYDQYAIYVLNGGAGGGGTLGITYTRTNAPDIPAQIIGVVIDWNALQSAYQRRINEAKPLTPKFTLKEYLNQTVAHELGHSINIWHHGVDIRYNYNATKDRWDPLIVPNISDKIRIFDRNGNLITTRPYSIEVIGGQNGTVEGGDISCMMNYYPYYHWGYTKGADGAQIYNQEPLLSLGRIFCKTKNGTGINATQLYFGNADPKYGNCLSQIKLK